MISKTLNLSTSKYNRMEYFALLANYLNQKYMNNQLNIFNATMVTLTIY